jgi:predicted nucleic acid-binding protein
VAEEIRRRGPGDPTLRALEENPWLRVTEVPVLGLVMLAKQRGRIPAARPLVESLRRGGLYLSDTVLDAALALVGE